MKTAVFVLLLLHVQLALGLPYMERRGEGFGDTEMMNTDRHAFGSDNIGNIVKRNNALEDRFQQLYIQMMMKKLGFKEAIEPFKTDQENASRG